MTDASPESEEAFLSKLREHPEDLGTWGIYADWLDEYGNRPATAEMIRRHTEANQKRLNERRPPLYAFLHRDTPRGRLSGVSNQDYVKAYPDSKEHDLISTLIPAGTPNHVFHISAWANRKASKRLVPALSGEGIDFNLPPDADDIDRVNQEKWSGDTTTIPETHHMSRRSSLKKYASSTVSRVLGLGNNAKDMAPTTVGSRLATVLREIKHSATHKDNSRLQSYVGSALKGDRRSDVYTGIRDELFRSKDPRAVQLARMYNWHKVGEGLEREKHLRDFVNNAAKGTRHAGSSQMFRQFYNQTVHQVNSRGEKGGADDRTRALMYRAMQKHLMNQTGKEHSYTDIEDALRRLGETEENQEKAKGQHGGAKFESPDYEHPAYTGTPKPNHAPDKRQVTDISKRAPGQYRRHRRFNIK